MGRDPSEVVGRVAGWLGHELSIHQVDLLQTYHDWIVTEAIRAGGLGPNETEKVWARHIADSLVFGIALGRAGSCVDLGSGIGLPGIPLAIMYPEVRFFLVDRSGRRCDLMRRAIAVLGIQNCSVVHRDLVAIDAEAEANISRAAIPIGGSMIHGKRLLEARGTAVLGLSRTEEPDVIAELPTGWSRQIVTVPAEILDTAVYLLRIEAT